MKIIEVLSNLNWKIYKIAVKVRRFFIIKKLGGCGENLEIYGKPTLVNPGGIKFGNNVSLNDGCILNATLSNIEVGNNCTISSYAQILGATYDVNAFLSFHHTHHIYKPVIIGDNTWVCSGAIICPGVRIMGFAIIAAGAVVTKDILEKNVIVAGNPAKVVKHIVLS